jgi:hypothetical protein
MSQKISAKVQKIIDTIIQSKSELKNWKELTEDEILSAVKGFEKTLRAEGSSYYNEYFNDSGFAETLLDISTNYSGNKKINTCIITSLGYMMQRYNLPESEEIYNYFNENSDKTGLAAYVALFFTKMENFEKHPAKWDYIMSIKDMKPAKMSEPTFEMIIKDKKNDIPDQCKVVLVQHFKEKAESANNEYGREHFLAIASQFE